MSKTIILDSEGNTLIPGDCVVHEDGRSGKLIYNPRHDSHRIVMSDKAEIEAKHMVLQPVVKISLAWSVPQVPVEYFSLRVHVPNTVRYIAIDALGNVYGFLTEPTNSQTAWSSEFPSYYLGELQIGNLHWSKSLVKVR